MKRYRVLLDHSALAPLMGQTLLGSRFEDFKDLTQARTFAESEKNNWNLVSIFDRQGDGGLQKIEHYQAGRRYAAR